MKINHIFLISLPIFFDSVNCLVCRSCTAEDYDSACRQGIDETTRTCDPNEGEEVCYEDYLLSNEPTSETYYRRDCAKKNFCDLDRKYHGRDVKICRTCKGDECNKRPLGSANIDEVKNFRCKECRSDERDGACAAGNNLKDAVCGPSDVCTAYAIALNDRKQFVLRGCAPVGFCRTLTGLYDPDLTKCSECYNELCNNLPI